MCNASNVMRQMKFNLRLGIYSKYCSCCTPVLQCDLQVHYCLASCFCTKVTGAKQWQTQHSYHSLIIYIHWYQNTTIYHFALVHSDGKPCPFIVFMFINYHCFLEKREKLMLTTSSAPEIKESKSSLMFYISIPWLSVQVDPHKYGLEIGPSTSTKITVHTTASSKIYSIQKLL